MLMLHMDHVRLGSKADMCSAKGHVRFTPDSDRESGHQSRVMSALPPKADMCGAARDVSFGPISDIEDPGAPTFRLGLRVRLRCRGANQNNDELRFQRAVPNYPGLKSSLRTKASNCSSSNFHSWFLGSSHMQVLQTSRRLH